MLCMKNIYGAFKEIFGSANEVSSRLTMRSDKYLAHKAKNEMKNFGKNCDLFIDIVSIWHNTIVISRTGCSRGLQSELPWWWLPFSRLEKEFKSRMGEART